MEITPLTWCEFYAKLLILFTQNQKAASSPANSFFGMFDIANIAVSAFAQQKLNSWYETF